MQELPPSKTRTLPLAFLVVAVVLVVVTATLGAVLDGDAGWTNATAAVGLVVTVVAAGVLLSTGQGWVNGTRLSLAALSTAVVGLGALALTAVTYVGGIGGAGVSGPGQAVQQTDKGAALSQQESNNEVQPPGYSHDVGSHPTYEGFMSMDDATVLRNVPGGTLLPNEVPLLKGELAQARAFAETVNTEDKALAAGYYNTTNDVPFMGAHFISQEYLMDGVFDAGKPEGLLFSRLGGGPDAEWQLVGVWYLIMPRVNGGVTETIPPGGFAGNLDLWHAHHGLCTRAGIISENNTAEGCRADNGNFIGDLRWMMHVWVWPETADNPDGVFTYLNGTLFDKQQRVQAGP